MLDVVVTGGMVVDGSGGPAVAATVGIEGGRIALIDPGRGAPQARRTVAAHGSVVAPGFVDVHTHYDAQAFWDPACTPSSLHGVTTVFGGNCGFSIAPLADPDYQMRLLSRVEGIPLEALEAGVPWTWKSFPEYLDALERSGLAVNMGFLVGHSALRRAVLGSRSHDPSPAEHEILAMRRLLAEGLAAGAFGFSSSWASTHYDGDGNPVPSRAAGVDELVTLASALGDFPGTQLEFIPTNDAFEDVHRDVMTQMALAARAPLNWNILIPRSAAWVDNRLSATDMAQAQGAVVVGLTYPDIMRSHVSFLSSAFDSIPGWAEVMALSPGQKMAALSDPARRAILRAGLDSPTGRRRRIETMVVETTYHPANAAFTGRQLGDIAGELGREPLDVLLDVVVSDDLRTGLVPEPQAADDEAWAARIATWSDPRVVIGASDGGAHLDILSTFDYPVRFLAMAREFGVLSLEETVRLLTDVPARLYGLGDRGRLAVGRAADLVVFDPDVVATGPVEWRSDLPAGASRLYAEPKGLAHVFVNGVEIVAGNDLTGERPGQLLRAGRSASVTATPG
jgi:N-acyl-D-aspartate/D-glutamate deacylase